MTNNNGGCFKIVVVFLMVIFLFCSCVSSCGSHKEKQNVETKSEFELKWGKHFSAWDGSCKSLVKTVKKNMNNPRSFEHVQTKIVESDNFLVITMTFRGENTFGGTVTQKVWCELDDKGNISKIEFD